MRITCPACHAETSLEAVVGREADARAVSTFIGRNLHLGDALVQYVALFRPPKRRLGLARMVSLIEELMPDIERGAIARKGRDWPAPADMWRAAIHQVLLNRDKGTLTVPLTGHGYLYEVLQGMSDKAEAMAERDTDAQRRARAHQAGPAHVAVAAQAASALPAAAAVPAPAADAPSAEVRRRLAQVRADVALRGVPVPPIQGCGGAEP